MVQVDPEALERHRLRRSRRGVGRPARTGVARSEEQPVAVELLRVVARHGGAEPLHRRRVPIDRRKGDARRRVGIDVGGIGRAPAWVRGHPREQDDTRRPRAERQPGRRELRRFPAHASRFGTSCADAVSTPLAGQDRPNGRISDGAQDHPIHDRNSSRFRQTLSRRPPNERPIGWVSKTAPVEAR